MLDDADLKDANLEQTAERVAEELAPGTQESPVPPVLETSTAADPPAPPPRSPKEDSPAVSRSRGKLTWGRERPTPRWKWIGFGVSAGLFTIGLGTTIGTGRWLTSNRGFRQKLLEAAEASLTDASQINDVDPNLPQGFNLCTYARSRPTDENGVEIGNPGQVRNASVADVCSRAESVSTLQTGAGIFTSIAAVSTLTFTLLLFVHRKPVTRSKVWRRHGMHLSTIPRRDGLGLHLGGRF